MIYLALGDSISIDDYTGVPGGGAASQFARLVDASSYDDLAEDGCTTDGVLEALLHVRTRPDVVTLTAGGNDFLLAVSGSAPGRPARADAVERPLANLDAIAGALRLLECPVVWSNIYDPTDGDDRLAEAIGLSGAFRPLYEELNAGIRAVARRNGFLFADLEALFRGHGIASEAPFVVGGIEPNHPGATAIAGLWHSLWLGSGAAGPG